MLHKPHQVIRSSSVCQDGEESATALWKGHRLFYAGSYLLNRWKIFLILLLAYDAFVIPYQWAFTYHEAHPTAMLIGSFIDFAFALDILVQFNTVHVRNNVWITNRKQIANIYGRSWLIVDIISAIPYELVRHVPFRWIKIVRLFGLLRVVRYSRIAHSIHTSFSVSTSVYRILKFGVMFVVGSHWCACVFYTLNAGSPEWIEQSGLSGAPPSHHFIAALQWSLSTIIPIGYCRIKADSCSSRIFSVFVMAFGVSIFTFAITKVVGLVHQLSDVDVQQFEANMDRVEAILDFEKVPGDLRRKIAHFFRFSYKSTAPATCAEEALIQSLSRQLRNDVINAINVHQISDTFVVDCVLSMKVLCFPPNEHLFDLTRGCICVVVKGSLWYDNQLIGPTAQFGTLSCSAKVADHGIPITRTWCQISVLRRDDLLPILVKHKEVQRRLVGSSSLQLRQSTESPDKAAWVTETVNLLTRDQAKSLLLTVNALNRRLQYEERLIRGVDRAFGPDISGRSVRSSSGSPIIRATLSVDMFKTPSLMAKPSPEFFEPDSSNGSSPSWPSTPPFELR
uniref:Ion transport domain-containing protein n=1 Tax=Spongospora subterranea TaxID=70186 RepID=A0A0H5QV01_9EUKA|eukprot:CRZ05587.1 hypothetical protein [Spongospora subterranea]